MPTTEIEGDIALTPAGEVHTIRPVGNGAGQGGGLLLGAGHGSSGGGTLDLAAGNTTDTGDPGSIGIGRIEGSARDITVGRLLDPVPTKKTYLRGTDVFLDARKDLVLRAPGLVVEAGSPVNDPTVPRSLRLLMDGSPVLTAGPDVTNLCQGGATHVQASASGLIVQKTAGGKVAFFDGPPVCRPVVSGSRSSGAAVASLIAALAALNLIEDNTDP